MRILARCVAKTLIKNGKSSPKLPSGTHFKNNNTQCKRFRCSVFSVTAEIAAWNTKSSHVLMPSNYICSFTTLVLSSKGQQRWYDGNKIRLTETIFGALDSCSVEIVIYEAAINSSQCANPFDSIINYRFRLLSLSRTSSYINQQHVWSSFDHESFMIHHLSWPCNYNVISAVNTRTRMPQCFSVFS